MNAVLGCVQLLLETDLDDEQRDYCVEMRSAAKGLLALLNDILDLSKIEAGKVEFEKVPFDLIGLCEEVTAVMSHLAEDRGLKLELAVQADVPRWGRGDPSRIRQILTNLLSNAIKFTHEGSIVVQASVAVQAAEVPTIRLAVQDTGIGIAHDKLEVVFGAFEQADGSTTRNYGGTGLGLAICKRFAEAMGGGIGVTSTLGDGSCFAVTLPFPRLADDETRQLSDALQGLRVVLASDQENMQQDLLERLRRLGARGLGFRSAEDALAAIRAQHGTTDAAQVVLVDVALPNGGASILAKRARNDPRLREVALVLQYDPETQCPSPIWRRLGFEGCVALRGDLDGFEFELSRVWHEHSLLLAHRAAEKAGGESGGFAASLVVRPRVLLAEDNAVNQKIGERMLAKLGCDVTVAANGRLAVEAVAAEAFDLVFMDCLMPEMDGYEATEAIVKSGARVPIVALTANVFSEVRERCEAVGMVDFVGKPVLMAELQRVLKTWVRAFVQGSEQATITAAVSDEGEVLDMAVLAELRELGEECGPTFFPDLVNTYVGCGREYVLELETALADKDSEGLRKMAHALKGSSANLGVLRVAELARKLEDKGRDQDWSEVDVWVPEVGRLLEQACAVLASFGVETS